jgi:hypothetical protein
MLYYTAFQSRQERSLLDDQIGLRSLQRIPSKAAQECLEALCCGRARGCVRPEHKGSPECIGRPIAQAFAARDRPWMTRIDLVVEASPLVNFLRILLEVIVTRI